MQFLELIEIFEDALDDVIYDIFRYLCRGDKGGTDTESGGIAFSTAIHAAGNDCGAVVGVVGDKFVDSRAIDGYHHGFTGSRSFLDRSIRVADGVDDSIDLVVAQGIRLFGRLELGCQFEVAQGPSLCIITISMVAR